MRVMIVDDEAFVRVSFKSYTNWEKHGYEIVGEAEDGEEAVKKMMELKPDIVFLDVKMPRLDGIGVLQKLKERQSHTKVVILSGYNEFEYAREAMRLGACDYIHKPCMNEELVLSCLENIKKIIEGERIHQAEFSTMKKSLIQNVSTLKSQFLKDFINGAVNQRWEVEEKINALGLKFRAENIQCMVVSICNFKTVAARYKGDNCHLLDFSVKNIIEELFMEEDEFEFFQYGENIYSVFKSYSGTRSLKEILQGNERIARTIREAFKQFLNIELSFGISSIHHNLMKIPHAFREALEANKLKFFGSRTAYHSDLSSKTCREEVISSGKVLNEMRKELAVKNFQAVRENINAVLEKENLGFHSEDRVRCFSRDAYSLLAEFIGRVAGERSMEDIQWITLDELMDAETLEQLKVCMLKGIDILEELANGLEHKNIGNLKIKRAVSYVKSHFREDLTLEDVAAAVELNSSYLSRCFKEETGVNFTEYLNRVRLDAAVAYLRNSEYKMYEIAELAGFRNVEYFNALFKKNLGKTPKEYKQTGDAGSKK